MQRGVGFVPMPQVRHGLPLGDTPGEFRITFVADKSPSLLEIVAVVVGGVRPTFLDQRLGIVEVAVDGLDGVVDAVFLYVSKEVSDNSAGLMGGDGMPYLSDLLAKNLRFDDHAFTVRGFPEGTRENGDVQLLHADTDA